MCISPHEMTSDELKQEIDGLRRLAEKHPNLSVRYLDRADALESFLNERIEVGARS